MSTFHVRHLGQYCVDDRIITDYGAYLKPGGIAMYNVLCRFADTETMGTTLSLKRLANLLGISKPTAIRYLKILKSFNLIAVSGPKPWQDGGRTANTYTLLDVPALVIDWWSK